jgi:hypothetical protein
MNPGITEESSKVASSLIDSLRSQPGVLGLIVLNIIFIIAAVFLIQDARRSIQDETGILLQQNNKMSEMLYNCVPVIERHLRQ